MSDQSSTISVIGPGSLGGAVIDLIRNQCSLFALHSVWGRTAKDSYLITEEREELAIKDFPEQDHDLGQLIVITTPDDQIEAVCDQLSENNIDWSSRTVIHMSGSQSHSVLDSLRKVGAQTGSLHPLQTFTKGDTGNRFKGIWFTFQGENSCYLVLESLVTEAGAHLKTMTAEQKKSMHIAAVFASNYLVSLMDTVEQITDSQGIENGLEMLNPIIHQTIENIITRGTEQSLSGPIARGDESTVKDHLKQLEDDSDLVQVYKHLGKTALNIAQRNGRITNQEFATISDILSSDK